MTPDELRLLLEQGESETVEFKSSLGDAVTVARTVAALANTGRSGTLVIGVNERDPSRSGLAHPGVTLDHVRQWVDQNVVPPPEIQTEIVSLEPGRMFAVVNVARSDRLHVTAGDVPVRRGNQVVPMQPPELRTAVTHTPPDEVADAILSLTAEVQSLRHEGSWKRQLPVQLVLLLLGVVLGYLLGLWNPLH